jgi:hypothetical protein
VQKGVLGIGRLAGELKMWLVQQYRGTTRLLSMFYFSYELDSKIQALGSEWRSVEIETGIWSVLICERPLPYVDTCLHTREREEGSSYGIRVEDSELPSHADLPETWGKGKRTDISFYILSRRRYAT